MNKTKLAEKSINFVIAEFFGATISFAFGFFALFLITNTTNNKTILVLLCFASFAIAIFALYLALKTALKPKIMIEYDISGIYLNLKKNRTEYIRYIDIENIYTTIPRGLMFYSFGTVHITAKQGHFKIGIVKEIEKVEKFLVEKVSQFYQFRIKR